MNEDLNLAVTVLEDCLVAGDNAEYALATVADDYGVHPTELKDAFFQRYGRSYLSYKEQ